MKRLFVLIFIIIAVAGFSTERDIAENKNIPFDDINSEPVPGKPREYTVNIKFTKIETVTVGTTLAAESLGIKRHRYNLSNSEWKYDPNTNVLRLNKDIDTSNYIVRVKGKYLTPVRVIPAEKIDPEQIRFVVDGRIGIPGKDFVYDSAANEIELLSCTTGKEKYIVQYAYPSGGASIGSMSVSDLSLPLLKYLDWPVKGNTVKLDQDGFYFSPSEGHFRSVWLVQLIPTGEGYNGLDITSGFTWDIKKNELKLESPVDSVKFSVFILGETE